MAGRDPHLCGVSGRHCTPDPRGVLGHAPRPKWAKHPTFNNHHIGAVIATSLAGRYLDRLKTGKSVPPVFQLALKALNSRDPAARLYFSRRFTVCAILSGFLTIPINCAVLTTYA